MAGSYRAAPGCLRKRRGTRWVAGTAVASSWRRQGVANMAPQVNRNDGADRNDQAATPSELLHGVRTLIIDDDEDARQMLGEYFDFMGATVSLAASGQEGLILY